MPFQPPDQIALALAQGPADARALCERLSVSQPTLSRVIGSMGARILRLREGRSIRYALRDEGRGFGSFPVYRVDEGGKIQSIGTLTPVRSEGYVMATGDGETLFSEGIPWWLVDMVPQGFMGRAYAAKHAATLGLPPSLKDWTDPHAVRALLAHGHDVPGNLLLGDLARERFLSEPDRKPVTTRKKPAEYVRLSAAAINGDETWSSAGGEQPKFTAYVETADGPRHVLVKFSAADANPVTERWRDLLLCEHHALLALRAAGVDAARTAIVDSGTQRFLEVERFDRIGLRGRCGLHSLSAIDSEFTGSGTKAWPDVTQALATAGHITAEAHQRAALLFAYGALIGNTDMHHGNLAFLDTQGRPYGPAPAYDMLPMTFQPRSGGLTANTINPVPLHPAVPNPAWRAALKMAQDFCQRIQREPRLSPNFKPCLQALGAHLEDMQEKIGRLG